MARRNTKQARLDAMNQHKKRSYKKKNSPQRKDDSRDWTYYAKLNLSKEKDSQ